jgi:copper ion binding protein
MNKKVYIEGMSCGHCVKHVEEALKELSGVKSVNVSLEGKVADLELTEDIAEEKIKDAIDDAGYEVVKIA